MSANCTKRWKMLIDRNMAAEAQMRLAVGLSALMLARMNKTCKVWVGTPGRVCGFLECSQPDIVYEADGICKHRRLRG